MDINGQFKKPLPVYDVHKCTTKRPDPIVNFPLVKVKIIDAPHRSPHTHFPGNIIHPCSDGDVRRNEMIGNLNISSNRQDRSEVVRPDVTPGRAYAGSRYQVMGQCLIGIAPHILEKFYSY